VSARDWFAPGQVWRPQHGRHGPRLLVVNVHRADRLVEVIDASTADRIRAKRALLRFSDIRANHRLDDDDPEDGARPVNPASGEPPRRDP
jgi:hypothetical protein